MRVRQQSASRNAFSVEPDNRLAARTEFNAKQFFADLAFASLNIYVVLRKLISKLQTFPKSIQETLMVRFYLSIYADDKILIRQMSSP